jgi:hypothetical protein
MPWQTAIRLPCETVIYDQDYLFCNGDPGAVLAAGNGEKPEGSGDHDELVRTGKFG